MEEDAIWAVRMIGFFALLAVEFIYFSFGAALQNLKMKEAPPENASPKEVLLAKLCEHPKKYVDTQQMIVTCVQLFLGGYYLRIFAAALAGLFSQKLHFLPKTAALLAVLVCGACILLAILVFGILLPKKIGMKYAEGVCKSFVGSVVLINTVLTPFTCAADALASLFAGLFGVRYREDEADVTEEEILSMVNEGHEQGVLLESEAEMINNIFEFSDKEAKDIMTNRSSIVGIDGNTPLKEAIGFMIANANSRYPVYIDNFDHILGIIYLKDACRMAEKETDKTAIKSIKGLIRPARYIPETRKIDALFRSMKALKTHVVLVIDEYGQTSGLITMEDILEEIVGNILDEYDAENAFIRQKGKDRYEIDGLTPLDELEETLGIDFSDVEFETLNGLLVSHLEHIPEDNERFDIDYGGYNFKVLSVENKVIKRVLVSKIPVK